LRLLAKSPRRNPRLLLVSIVLFGLMAIISWWMVIEDGPSPARVIAAVATSVGAVLQAIVRRREIRKMDSAG
jgi:hypothetical protein